MRATTPVRALVTTGVAVSILFGGGAAPVLGSSAEAVPALRRASPASTHASTQPATQVLAHERAVRSKAARTTGRYARSVQTSSLAAVNAAYLSQFAPGLTVGTGFTGDDRQCIAGTTSAESRAATLRAVNFIRSLAGLAPVAFSAELNARSQYTALMMSANHALSHDPSRRWRCYTSTGAANAGRSNLALAYPEITSAGLVQLYTSDPGAENRAVGHRRWLLNPFATAMGTGSTRTANALTVIGPSSTSRPNPSWVSWPSAGWFPDTLEPGGRWSLSAGSRAVNFKKARIRVYRNGVRIPATKQPVVNGYGQPTLVWQVPAGLAKSGAYTVWIKGIRVGHKRFSTKYRVHLFAPR